MAIEKADTVSQRTLNFILLSGLLSRLDLDQTPRGLKNILVVAAGATTAVTAAMLGNCIAA